MAKKQTRRTVSLGLSNYTRLTEFARASGVPASQVTEYALDALMAQPLDRQAFDAWRGPRSQQVETSALVTNESARAGRKLTAVEAYRERDRLRAELQAKKDAWHAEVAARKERQRARAELRAALGGGVHLCKHCDGRHTSRHCPNVPYEPRVTNSKSERAVRAIKAESLSLREAAQRFGVSHQAVAGTWKRVFPNERPPRQRVKETT